MFLLFVKSLLILEVLEKHFMLKNTQPHLLAFWLQKRLPFPILTKSQYMRFAKVNFCYAHTVIHI